MELQKVVQSVALEVQPRSPQRDFQPHLSVGQVRRKAEVFRLVSELQAVWQPVRFVMVGIDLIWRGEPPN